VEGNFSQGIMEILIGHIVGQRLEAGVPSFDERNAPLANIQNESNIGIAEISEAVYPSNTVPEVQRALSPEDIIRLATRNAGKLLNERRNHD
jgi:hypothetical protein